MIGFADIASLLSGGAVGFILSLIGGGGSIMATPLLIYLVGLSDAHAAIGTSALAVSVNAFSSLIPHARRGLVHWRCAAVFAVAGMVGAAFGAMIGKLTDAHTLLPLFAFGMIGVGIAMLGQHATGGDTQVSVTRPVLAKLSATGVGVGTISGFFGIGGGFLIVPGLMASTGMSMRNAIGTSLVCVTAFGATTAISYALDDWVNWRVAGLFILGGIGGVLAGANLGQKLALHRGALQKVFAAVVFATAAYMLYRSFVRI